MRSMPGNGVLWSLLVVGYGFGRLTGTLRRHRRERLSDNGGSGT